MNYSPFFNFIEFEKRLSKHTITAYRADLNAFNNFLELTFDITNSTEVLHIHIRSWIVSLVEQGCTPRTVNRKISALKTFFKFLQRRGEVESNPFAKVIAPRIGKKLPVSVNKDRIEKLLDHIEFPNTYEGVRDQAILEVCYGTGVRRSELINLTILDVDFYHQRLKVLGKGNKERVVPFGIHLVKVLEGYLVKREEHFGEAYPEDALFLTKKGKKLYPKLVYNIVNRYLSAVTTVEQRSPHVLRHSFATHLSDAGADLNAIKKLLGHANLAATQIYTHNSIEKLKNVYAQAHPKGRS